ncbi:MAG TPA: hypothetical protein VIG69_09775 [Candidatus Methylomirabilis sp.]|jgi:hypothetical protein
MARVSMEAFEGRDVEPVFIAGSVREAERVEEVLTRLGIEFAVKIEPFVRYILAVLPSEHEGAAFYVLSGHSAYCRRALAAAGLGSGLMGDSP